MTLNNCAVLWIGTLIGGPLCRESNTLCRLKIPTVVCMITCRLSSCKTGVYNVRLLIILERDCSSMYRKKDIIVRYLVLGKPGFQMPCLTIIFLRCLLIRTCILIPPSLNLHYCTYIGNKKFNIKYLVMYKVQVHITKTKHKNLSKINPN